MQLYGYYQSSAAYRVRIALNIKNLPVEHRPVALLDSVALGEFRRTNPQGFVPALATADGLLTQSIAILDYLEEHFPQTPLLPSAADQKAYVRSVALLIACDIHPLNNLRVLQYLRHRESLSKERVSAWCRQWIEDGFTRLESFLVNSGFAGDYVCGQTVSIADCCLVPQVFNARRLGCDLSAYPTITRVDARCTALPAFAAAHPARQADAPG